MSFKETVYSILVVSSSQSFTDNISAMLPAASYSPVKLVTNASAAKRELADRSFDMVIVNSPLLDDNGVRLAIDASDTESTVALVVVQSEIFEQLYDRVAGCGVFLLPKPFSRNTLSTALGWLGSARERLRKNEKRSLSIEEKMQEIRTVNRAKWLLISELKMTEPEAHRYIEKQAMDRCVAKRVVAEEIIRTYG